MHRSYLPIRHGTPLDEGDRARGLAHVTGGGDSRQPASRCASRAGLGATVDRSTLVGRSRAVFRVRSRTRRGGRSTQEEMDRVFNMGVGMIVVVDPVGGRRLWSKRLRGRERYRGVRRRVGSVEGAGGVTYHVRRPRPSTGLRWPQLVLWVVAAAGVAVACRIRWVGPDAREPHPQTCVTAGCWCTRRAVRPPAVAAQSAHGPPRVGLGGLGSARPRHRIQTWGSVSAGHSRFALVDPSRC